MDTNERKLSILTGRQASRVNMQIVFEDHRLELYFLDTDGTPWEEYIAAYTCDQQGAFYYHGSCFPGDHDFPAHIPDEKELRELLPAFSRYRYALGGR